MLMILGIDRGAVSTKAVLFDGKLCVKNWVFGGDTPFKKSTEKIVEECLASGIKKVKLASVNTPFSSGIRVEPFTALKKGVLFLYPDAKVVIEVGGERARFLRIGEKGETEDFAMTEKCASGTGLFIEQQAGRFQMSVEDFAAIALKAKKPAKIAGRCAVFAKSDMIHLQQKGVPAEEIAYGLCYAVATNIVSALLKGKDIASPVVFAGGCSKNGALVRALRELLPDVEIIPSPMPGMECALGACLLAANDPEVDLEEVVKSLDFTSSRELVPLSSDSLRQVVKERHKEPEDIFENEAEGYVGIDVGSVSTDIVVVDRAGNLLSAVYLPTRGRPVDVLVEGFEILARRFPKGLKVLGCCTTGSGRYLAQALVNADLVKNEITCQMKGTLFYFPDADTIFEIGGQDSKYIYMEGGRIRDFTMNKVCAAGTGSFIEEQTSLMGIDVKKDFARMALSAEKPALLNHHCTVFMERTVSSALSYGFELRDVCAGIAHAIVKNYLEKVVGNRKVGKKIVFQGGVASNDAVVSAFESVLGKEIYVHPYNRLSGAIGAALIARDQVKGESKFRFPEKMPEKMKTFECKQCSNFCDVGVLKLGKSEFAFFGDTCERYTSQKRGKGVEGPDLVSEFIQEAERYFQEKQAARTIGIPRASVMIAYLPFWATFFSELGFKPVLSPPSSHEILILSSRLLQAVTCIPVKFVAGHVAWLSERVDFIFLPAIYAFGEKEFTCPYTQALPTMLRDISRVIAPTLSMDEEGFVEGFKKYEELLSISSAAVRTAFRKAMNVQIEFETKMRNRAEEVIKEGGITLAVIGRPYNIYDSYLNLNLFSHLRRLGFTAVPMNLLRVSEKESPLFPWKYSRDGFKTLLDSLKRQNIYPVIISNFGCGPDAFAHKVFDEILKEYPALFLEFDEHRGEAGLITRLEAYSDLLREAGKRVKEKKHIFIPERSKVAPDDLKNRKVYIPYFSDHAYALSGVMRYAGINAEVLPLPDAKTKELGERYSSGKECHAYSVLLGDLVALLEREKEPFVFLFPGTKIPCLLYEYATGMNIFLREVGATHAKVYTPVAEEFISIVGMKGAERFYKALFAIDVLHKAFCLKLPFEVRKGEAFRIYHKALTAMEKAVESGDVLLEFKRFIKELEKVEVKRDDRPVVGVAGDIYTRVNRSANFDLFNALAERGLVGVPAPFEVDILDFGISRDFYEGTRKWEYKKAALAGILLLRKELKLWSFYRAAEHILSKWDEPSYKKIREYAGLYTDNLNNELFYLNVAKMVDFAEKGVEGIINATCFNCMVGTASSAVIEKIKNDYKIPVVTLVYSGQYDPDTEALLDAFAEEVKERRARRSRFSFDKTGCC